MDDNGIQRAFFCYSSMESEFIIEVAKHLKPTIDHIFCFQKHQLADDDFKSRIANEIAECDVMVVFASENTVESEWQKRELSVALDVQQEKKQIKFVIVNMTENKNLPNLDNLAYFTGYPRINQGMVKMGALETAIQILNTLKLPLETVADLPYNPHLFSYEKDIIRYFNTKRTVKDLESADDEQTKKTIAEIEEKTLNGCPSEWPMVFNWIQDEDELTDNQISETKIGQWRDRQASVVSAALSEYHHFACDNNTDKIDCLIQNKLTFPEAGPRLKLYYPRPGNNLRVGILVSGGIAPGINAVIDGIAQRHEKYASEHDYSVTIYGLKNGFYAFEDLSRSIVVLKRSGIPGPNEIVTSDHSSEGGSAIGTSRVGALVDGSKRLMELEKIAIQVFNWRINILYIIGGDGSMKAAHAVWSYAKYFAEKRDMPYRLSIIAIPKTMDNDIFWVWQTFGFLSAVERARHVIETLSTEAKSNPRLGVIQLFGSDSGFVVSHAVLASSTSICDAALIPEVDFNMKELAKSIEQKIIQRGDRFPYGLIVMAETAIPTDAMDFVEKTRKNYIDVGLTKDEKDAIRDFEHKRQKGRRIEGQTNDDLRRAGLKIVSQGIRKLLPKKVKGQGGVRVAWDKLRIFTNEPRHLLRSIPPSSIDMIFGHRLGTLAVDNALAGYTDFMISQWLTEYALVPLKLVVLGRKRIPKTGVFWKSVLAKTDQPTPLKEDDNGKIGDAVSKVTPLKKELKIEYKSGCVVKLPYTRILGMEASKDAQTTNIKTNDDNTVITWPDLNKNINPMDFVPWEK